MTANHAFVLWIVIVFVVVSSARKNVEGDNNGTCKKNVSLMQSPDISNNGTAKPGWFSKIWSSIWGAIFHTSEVESDTLLTPEETCCMGYEYKNGKCVLKCRSSCNNGYCDQPNICKCNNGWEGDFCNQSRLCLVRIDFTQVTTKFAELKNMKNVSEDPQIKLNRPACSSECHDQFGSTATNRNKSADMVSYLIPIDSCNTITAHRGFWKKNGSVIGAVIVIALFVAIVCGVYHIRKKQKVRRKRSDQPMQCAYAEYVEENPIYS